MKNEKKIIEIKKDLKTRREYLELKLAIQVQQEEVLYEICDHSIVFNFNDTNEHNTNKSIFYCPACNKKINSEIKNSIFEKSKIINIDAQNFEQLSDVTNNIQNEVETNMDYYYDDNIEDDLKAQKMNDTLKKGIMIKKKTLL